MKDENDMDGEKRMQSNEQKKRIRLIALDLDQTTLRTDKSLSEENRSAILAAIKAGIHDRQRTGLRLSARPYAGASGH